MSIKIIGEDRWSLLVIRRGLGSVNMIIIFIPAFVAIPSTCFASSAVIIGIVVIVLAMVNFTLKYTLFISLFVING